eukprot:364735-Chlamydomonas_euryale.AAC.10
MAGKVVRCARRKKCERYECDVWSVGYGYLGGAPGLRGCGVWSVGYGYPGGALSSQMPQQPLPWVHLLEHPLWPRYLRTSFGTPSLKPLVANPAGKPNSTHPLWQACFPLRCDAPPATPQRAHLLACPF